MGQVSSSPDTVVPDYRKDQSNDPMIGFPNGRKERVAPLTQDQMDNALVPLMYRDYCVDKYVALQSCLSKQSFFNTWACNAQWHHLEDCHKADAILRHKEHERERRLLERKRRIQAKANSSVEAI
ncbi:hypothetical protein LOTGIDRAFT_234648 [Lottia gigantea]|uniref:NADH dehydrogenase [ubiquinone] 1 beta subcomplex subunit 7 n=1 Tax=Lottia gigantea TaxID=225164 RepID=V4A540_LOTGI|nr:hypothetical protein LOTGIDRAFT_234648 [Lottia gigantea]ESO88346.1 hypothetical protein LOTGIDRAFT_234648 [Lottia gigantea]